MGPPRQAVARSSRILRRRSKSSSKSERDLDCVASLDWFESDPSSPSAARVEVASKTINLSICLARSGSSDSSRLSMNLPRSLHRVGVEASGFLGSARWLLKLPKPLAMQIQEPKMKVVPSSSCAGEAKRCYRVLQWMLDEHLYLARQLSVFYRHAH
jgi:hypothetical protein